MMEWDKLGSITVLIVDDDAFNRQLIISLLSRVSSISYIEAEDGIEALEILEKEKIDIILLDLYMPRLNGLNTIKEIKKNPLFVDIPVIIISTDELVMKEFYALGANDFVSKPFRLNDLQEKIYKYLEKVYYKNRFNKKEEKKVKETKKDTKIVEKEDKLFNIETIEKSQKEMFRGIASIIALRDENIKITAKLVKAFAELLNYSKSDIDSIYLSSVVYNIGSLSSNRFKNSYESISNDTNDMMYIYQGYQIIKNSIETPFIKILKAVIVQHKENYNGTGMPQELKGDEISDYAQIIHLVEIFNILFKQNNSRSNIYNFFKKQSGKRFNPKLLASFLDYFEYFVELRSKYIKEN